MFKIMWTFRKKISVEISTPSEYSTGCMDLVKNSRFYMQISKCIGYQENGLADRILLKNGSLVSQDNKLQTGFWFKHLKLIFSKNENFIFFFDFLAHVWLILAYF